MKENEQTDRRLDTPSESNREKHINFPEVEEESSNTIGTHTNTSERQKQWREEIEEGKKEQQSSGNTQVDSAQPMDEDDTLGIP